MFTSRTLLPAVLLVVFSGCARLHSDGDPINRLTPEILEFMEEQNVPSVSIAVARKNEVLFERSFGWADRENRIPATPDTMYDLASISKVFTATALMILQERRVLDLDSPIQSYLEDLSIVPFGVDPAEITVRRVIQHTGGLPMYWENYEDHEVDAMPSLEEVLQHYSLAAFEPGADFIYSNVGHGLSQYLIESLSTITYSRFLHSEILVPLALESTAAFRHPPDGNPVAVSYNRDGSVNGLRNSPIAAVYSSTHDLIRFGMFHLGNYPPGGTGILSKETIERMQKDRDPGSGYCLPWKVEQRHGFQTVSFTGASGTVITLVPEEDLAVVVLANRFQANTVQVSDWVLQTQLPGFESGRPSFWSRWFSSRRVERAPALPELLNGHWKGTLRTPEGPVETEMAFDPTDGPRMKYGDSDGWFQSMDSQKGIFRGGVFSAYFPVRIPSRLTERHDHWSWTYLKLEGDSLRGYAVAHASDGPYFGLPFYMELDRQPQHQGLGNLLRGRPLVAGCPDSSNFAGDCINQR